MKILSEVTTDRRYYTNINQVLVSSLSVSANSIKYQNLFFARMRMCS